MIVAGVAAQGFDKLLSVADVERLTALKGVKTVTRLSQPGAGGDLNFAGPDGKLVVMVNFGNAQLYRKAREQKEIKVADQTFPMELFAHAVPGLGDEAFAAPPGKAQTAIYARKGDRAVSVTTYYTGTGAAMKPVLSEAQLKEIAATILSRQ